jgi:hypothetical protein
VLGRRPLGPQDDLHPEREDPTFPAVRRDEREDVRGPAARHDGQKEGWVFPSDSKEGHVTNVAKAFEIWRLLCVPWGITNAQTAMIYQHPSLERVRAIVNERPLPAPKNPGPVLVRHNPRHNDAA